MCGGTGPSGSCPPPPATGSCKTGPHPPWDGDLRVRRFLERLPGEPPLPYPGRGQVLGLHHLREFWFHLTNRCNQACRHCLFAASPADPAGLEVRRVMDLAREAAALGCRVFALTGGEPLVYPDFAEVVDYLLHFDQAHVMVLTNALLVKDYAADLARWPRERFHLQVSLDGLEQNHDHLRGPGAFAALMANLAWLKAQGLACTLSMCVTRANYLDLPALVDLAGEVGAANFHLIWYFVRGRGTPDDFVAPEAIFPQVVEAHRRAAARGLSLDNLDTLKAQVFSPPGTIYDGAGSGWESLAVGPDGRLYPSPALVGVEALATDITPDLKPPGRPARCCEICARPAPAPSPPPCASSWGAATPTTASCTAAPSLGDDPYIPLYEKLALWLIAREAA